MIRVDGKLLGISRVDEIEVTEFPLVLTFLVLPQVLKNFDAKLAVWL